MILISQRKIEVALSGYGATYSPELAEKIRIYIELLLKWNATVSLTTVTDVTQILRFHFGESLFALPLLPVEKSRLADVGSGAGFPGLALALSSPDLQVTLIEPNTKKSTFLSEAIRSLCLANVRVVRARMEDIGAVDAGFDVVTSRALGRFQEFLSWARLHLKPNGQVTLWIGEGVVQQIISEPYFSWGSPVAIPDSVRRVILVGSLRK